MNQRAQKYLVELGEEIGRAGVDLVGLRPVLELQAVLASLVHEGHVEVLGRALLAHLSIWRFFRVFYTWDFNLFSKYPLLIVRETLAYVDFGMLVHGVYARGDQRLDVSAFSLLGYPEGQESTLHEITV